MTTLSLTLFTIDINRATAMFLSSLNRFQMFSSRFRLLVTGAQNKYVPVFLGITLIDSFTNEHSWRKIVQKQTEINFYSSCPFKVEYFTCICSFSIYSLCIGAPFCLRYNWHAWCFSNVNSVSFWGIFRSSSNEIEKNLFDVGTDDFKVERRSNENAS